MKYPKHITLILLAAISFARPLPAALGADIILEIKYPKDREVIHGNRVIVSAALVGKLDTLHVVRIKGFGVTHNLLANPARAFRLQDGKQKVWVNDPYLPHSPGEHKLRIQVFRQGGRDPLIERTISLKVEQPSLSKLRSELELETRRIVNSSYSLQRSRDNFFHSHSADRTLRSRTPEAAKDYFSGRNSEFLARVNAYGTAARIYMFACMTKQAEAAVRVAEEIYKQDSSKVTTGSALPPFPIVFDPKYANDPPYHFEIAAELNIREGKMDVAQRWILDSVTWYQHQINDNPYISKNQKQSCSKDIVDLYRQLADLSYILEQDLASYNSWMKKAESLQMQNTASGLLGQ